MQLKRVGEEDRGYLFNVMQKYLYELSRYYRDDLDGEGNIAYPWFDTYFTMPEREAYLFREGDTTVGFALLNKHSDLGEDIDHAIAEFTIFPLYRHGKRAERALALLLQDRPGLWELNYHNQNEAAATFWSRALKAYDPEPTPMNGAETILLFRVF